LASEALLCKSCSDCLPDPPSVQPKKRKRYCESDCEANFIINKALRFAAENVGLDQFQEVQQWNDVSNSSMTADVGRMWIVKWIEVVNKRMALACYWVENHGSENFVGKYEDGAIKKFVKSVVDRLRQAENAIKSHILYLLIPATFQLGKARCINRFQLIFYENLRISQICVVRKKSNERRFLMASDSSV
jgi:hypothetical protein